MRNKLLNLSLLLFLALSTNAFSQSQISNNNPPEWAKTAYGKKLFDQYSSKNNAYALALFRPTYVLPFYYTFNPAQRIYGSTTPDQQRVLRAEFEGQMSFRVPVVTHLFDQASSLNVAYTQLSVWQVYANSQYFRETDYQPEIFVEKNVAKNWVFRTGLIQVSNGRGNTLERSWDRAYGEAIYSGNNWLVSVEPWVVILKRQAMSSYNSDILHYMGNGRILTAYKFNNGLELTFMTRNNMQSDFKRGAEEFDVSYPINQRIRVYTKFFSGYGQTLIEYNHYTNAAGIGIALNDWI